MSDGEEGLPEGWASTLVTELAARSRSALTIGPFGSSLKVSDYRDSGVPLVFVRDIRAERFGGPGTKFVTVDKASELAAHRVTAGDLLITKMGDPPGDTTVYPADRPEGVVTADCIKMSVGEASTASFLKYWLRSQTMRDRLLDETAGVAQQKLSLERFRTIELPLPPLPEQRRIVAKLEELLARSRRAKEALDAIPPLLETLRRSILAAAFRGDLTADWRAEHPDVEPADRLLARIRVERRKKWEEAELARLRAKGKAPTDDRWKEKYREPEPVHASELPELPEGWAWAAWREVGFSQNGRPFPSADYQDQGVRLLRPGNLHVSGRVLWSGDNTRRLPNSHCERNPDLVVGGGELIMNLTAQSLKDDFLGRVCVTAQGDEACLLNQRLARLTPVDVSATYVLWLFRSPLVRRYVDSLNSGSLIQHMFTSQVDDFALPVAPAAEQSVICRRVTAALLELESLATLRANACDQTNELERALLATAFRGDLVPQDPSDEPASVLLARLKAATAVAEQAGAKRLAKKRTSKAPA